MRWDVEHVKEWLVRQGSLPERRYGFKELDQLYEFVIHAIANGKGDPEDGRDVFTGNVGMM